jgi:hypothetical protein
MLNCKFVERIVRMRRIARNERATAGRFGYDRAGGPPMHDRDKDLFLRSAAASAELGRICRELAATMARSRTIMAKSAALCEESRRQRAEARARSLPCLTCPVPDPPEPE